MKKLICSGKMWTGLIMGFIVLMIIYDETLDKSYVVEPTPIQAVYMHRVNEFSVAVYDGERVQIKLLPRGHHIDIIIKYGLESTYSCNINDSGQEGSCTITIRTIDEINGAGWNNGKFGSGNTIRVD